MKKRPTTTSEPDQDDLQLAISPEKVCFVIVKLREFEVKDAVTEPDPGSNPSDDRMISVLEDHGDDPVRQELSEFISALSVDEQTDLVALAWLGRDDNTAEDWPGLREEAAGAHRPRANHTANYLIGMPLASEYLEEGLSILGLSCEDFEIDRL